MRVSSSLWSCCVNIRWAMHASAVISLSSGSSSLNSRSSLAVETWSTCRRAPAKVAMRTASSVEEQQASAERMRGWRLMGTSGRLAYSSLQCSVFLRMMSWFSQWAAISMSVPLKIFSRLLVLSTSMFPVLEPMKSLMPHTRFLSSLWNSVWLSLVAPKQQEWLTIHFSFSSSIFCSRASMVVVCGCVLGMSMMEVTPPAAAAQLSVKMSALCVSPGSRKCTWSSMIPGSRQQPVASMVSSQGEVGASPRVSTSAIMPFSITTEPFTERPSFTIVALCISVLFINSVDR